MLLLLCLLLRLLKGKTSKEEGNALFHIFSLKPRREQFVV